MIVVAVLAFAFFHPGRCFHAFRVSKVEEHQLDESRMQHHRGTTHPATPSKPEWSRSTASDGEEDDMHPGFNTNYQHRSR
jgi:hypothetical protein